MESIPFKINWASCVIANIYFILSLAFLFKKIFLVSILQVLGCGHPCIHICWKEDLWIALIGLETKYLIQTGWYQNNHFWECWFYLDLVALNTQNFLRPRSNRISKKLVGRDVQATRKSLTNIGFHLYTYPCQSQNLPINLATVALKA